MLTTVIFAAIAAPIVMPAPASATSISGPGERFAADIVTRADLGFRVRELEVSYDAGAPTFEVLMGDGREAYRYELDYTVDGRKPVAYRSREVASSQELRVYDAEVGLVAMLRESAPGVLSEEAGTFSLEAGPKTVWIDRDAYHVVSATARGVGADTVVAEALTRSLAAGYELVDVRGSRDAGAPVIDMVLAGDEWRVIHVVTDRRGRVAQVEIREQPAREVYKTYLHADSLLGELKVGRAIHSLTLEPTPSGDPRLVGTMRAGVRFVVEPDEFEHNEVEYGC